MHVHCGTAGLRLTSEGDIVVVLQAVDRIKIASNVEFACSLVQVFHGRVILVSTKNLLRLVFSVYYQTVPSVKVSECLLVRPVNIVDLDDSKIAIITEIAKSETGSRLDT